MNILVIGEASEFEECRLKFGSLHKYSLASGHGQASQMWSTCDVLFDFSIDDAPGSIGIYTGNTRPVFFDTSKRSLAGLLRNTGPIKSSTFGFNGMPTFVNRPVLEVSVFRKNDIDLLSDICIQLNTEYQVVDDRVGLVTPRVICMIINEAYFTVQEGTATRDDIDLAMKLGTNYPFGPFEWCQRIGIRHVYELLDAVYTDTRDERYKICPLLKKEYLAIT